MEIVKMKISDLKEDPLNLRSHGMENLEMIKRSLQTSNQYRPLIVDKFTNVVKIGNGRLKAMRALGWEEADCILMDFSQHEGMDVIDNRLNELSAWADDDLNDWLLNTKGLNWWGIDTNKAIDLSNLERKLERKKNQPAAKASKEPPVCPCCGKPLKKKKVNLL